MPAVLGNISVISQHEHIPLRHDHRKLHAALVPGGQGIDVGFLQYLIVHRHRSGIEIDIHLLPAQRNDPLDDQLVQTLRLHHLLCGIQLIAFPCIDDDHISLLRGIAQL